MKRYLLFAGDAYYPLGGWDDLRGQFDTVEDAITTVAGRFDWWQVVDTETGKIVQGNRLATTKEPVSDEVL